MLCGCVLLLGTILWDQRPCMAGLAWGGIWGSPGHLLQAGLCVAAESRSPGPQTCARPGEHSAAPPPIHTLPLGTRLRGPHDLLPLYQFQGPFQLPSVPPLTLVATTILTSVALAFYQVLDIMQRETRLRDTSCMSVISTCSTSRLRRALLEKYTIIGLPALLRMDIRAVSRLGPLCLCGQEPSRACSLRLLGPAQL